MRSGHEVDDWTMDSAPVGVASWDSQTLLDAQAMAHVGIWEWSADTGDVRWSPELCRIYGFDPDEFEHDFGRFMATVIPEDRRLIAEAMNAAFTRGSGFDFELRIVGEDGVARTLHAKGVVELDRASGAPARLLGTTQDITARKHAEDGLADSEQRFRAAFDDAPIGMALVGVDGRLLRVNRAATEILGRSSDELLTSDFAALTHPDDLAADLVEFNRLLDGEGESYRLEKRYLRPGGEVVWAQLSVSLVRAPDGAADYFVSQIQDVSEERRLREHLHRLADHDALTGLHNRRRFDQDLLVQASRANRYGEQAAIVLLDLNHFKQVNDLHGHHQGDDVLRRVAGAIRARLRTSDSAARIGGDEFAALLMQVSAEQAERIAEDLRAAVDEAAGLGVTVSVGVAPLHSDGSPVEAMKAADRAMYAAKMTRGRRSERSNKAKARSTPSGAPETP